VLPAHVSFRVSRNLETNDVDRCFYINLPIGVLPVGTIVFLFRTPENAKPQEATLREKMLQMDPLGTILLMGAIITYLTAVTYGGQAYPWSSSLVIGTLVGSGLLCIAFGLCEYWQGERAVVIPRLFRRRAIWLSAVFSILQSGAFFAMVYYLPIYFQAIRGSTPISSGVQNLAFIIPAMAGALVSGFFITATGMSTAVMVGGVAVATIGCGLCYTFGLDTSTGRWAGYQILTGFCLGATFQTPLIVAQVSVEGPDLSSATSMMLCFQTIGGALFVSAAQSAFVNSLLSALPTVAPGVDPMRVVATGAGQLREVFAVGELPGILAAYLEGIHAAFLLACAVAGAAFSLAVFLPWNRLDTEAIKENGGGG
jgi:hypothetical protein